MFRGGARCSSLSPILKEVEQAGLGVELRPDDFVGVSNSEEEGLSMP